MILVDDRIGSVEFANRLRAISALQHPVPVEVTHLDFADFAFAGVGHNGDPLMVGIERKTVSDLVNSIRDGRLKGHQLPGMLERYEHRYLLIEGVYRRGDTGRLEVLRGTWRPMYGNMSYTYVENHLTSLEVQFGVVVRRSGSEAETVRVIVDLYKYWQKPEHTSCVVMTSTPLPIGLKPPLVARLAKELGGVGLKRALELAKRFKTPEELMAAGEGELKEVEGVGKGMAKRIWEELHGSREDRSIDRRAA